MHRDVKHYTVIHPAPLASVDIRYRASAKRAVVYDKAIALEIRRHVGPGVFNQHVCPDDDQYSVHRTGDFDWRHFRFDKLDLSTELLDNDLDGFELESGEEMSEDI